MFLMAGDGTPYDILYDLVGGHKVAYPLAVVGLFYLYITAFYFIYYFAVRRKKEKTPLSVIGENACEEVYDLQAANHSN
jgi:phosphotransferase system  glucose/maltose/N-acetylglucosamine-specific IIC component